MHIEFKSYCNTNKSTLLKELKMKKIEYWTDIKTRALLGISGTAISNELEIVYGAHAQKYNNVTKLVALFQEGKAMIIWMMTLTQDALLLYILMQITS